MGRPRLNDGTCAASDCTRRATLQTRVGDVRYYKKYCSGHLLHGPNYVPRKYKKHGTSRAVGYAAEGRRAAHLEYHYRMSLEDYDRLFAAQKGCCGICGNASGGNLSVDHNHETGEVRGLLCVKCNAAIGALGDDVALLLKAAEWVALKHL